MLGFNSTHRTHSIRFDGRESDKFIFEGRESERSIRLSQVKYLPWSAAGSGSSSRKQAQGLVAAAAVPDLAHQPALSPAPHGGGADALTQMPLEREQCASLAAPETEISSGVPHIPNPHMPAPHTPNRHMLAQAAFNLQPHEPPEVPCAPATWGMLRQNARVAYTLDGQRHKGTGAQSRSGVHAWPVTMMLIRGRARVFRYAPCAHSVLSPFAL